MFSQRLYPDPSIYSVELHHIRRYCSKEKIRNQFVSEIHRILNWCGYRNGWNYHEKYLEVYHKIKKGLEPGHYSSYNLLKLCWLYTKEIRREIKAWKGDPFDLLYFLVHHGIIERAVSIKLKRLIQK